MRFVSLYKLAIEGIILGDICNDIPIFAIVPFAMEFKAEHTGKWVAVKGEKVISSATSFSELRKRIHKRKDRKSISLDLIPKGLLTSGF